MYSFLILFVFSYTLLCDSFYLICTLFLFVQQSTCTPLLKKNQVIKYTLFFMLFYIINMYIAFLLINFKYTLILCLVHILWMYVYIITWFGVFLLLILMQKSCLLKNIVWHKSLQRHIESHYLLCVFWRCNYVRNIKFYAH